MNDIEALAQAMLTVENASVAHDPEDPPWGWPTERHVAAIIAALPEGWVLREDVPLMDIIETAEAAGAQQERERLRVGHGDPDPVHPGCGVCRLLADPEDKS